VDVPQGRRVDRATRPFRHNHQIQNPEIEIKMPPLFAYWVDNLSPFAIRFSGNIGIRWYGLAYVLGFVAGGWLMMRYHQKGRSSLPAGQVADFIVALVVGVIVGGRLGYFLLYDLDLFLHDPLVLFRVWEGGMASHGGFVGVVMAIWWFSWRTGLSFLHLFDLVASTSPAGLFLGRIANFINGELWGKVSTVSWAVIFPKSEPEGTPIGRILPRHPSQLYEAALEGALLLAYMQWRFWKSDVVRRQPGRLTGESILLYAIVRVICEIYREPDVGVTPLLGLSRGTFYSLFLAALGVVLIVRGFRRRTDGNPAAR
jgi:phosphatidylglycerol:prolipoprotein diacylglycerol transferase